MLSITLDVLHVKWRLRDLFENHPGRSSLLVSASRPGHDPHPAAAEEGRRDPSFPNDYWKVKLVAKPGRERVRVFYGTENLDGDFEDVLQ